MQGGGLGCWRVVDDVVGGGCVGGAVGQEGVVGRDLEGSLRAGGGLVAARSSQRKARLAASSAGEQLSRRTGETSHVHGWTSCLLAVVWRRR